MRQFHLSGGLGLDHLKLGEAPKPQPGVGEVLVRIKAATLNYRDLLIVKGGYGSRQKTSLVPVSDGAGVVESVGAGVTRVKAGDRVIPAFFQGWTAGEPVDGRLETALGGAYDGCLREYCCFRQEGLIPTPGHLSDVEAAALPCAGLTAWSAVISQGRVGPGDLVLVQGTGGVSIFALQFAKLAGAEVILTSSSDDKLARGKALGADHLINYKKVPEWGKAARELSRGRGVDHVVEVGGAGTIKQSIRAIRPGGTISMIGVLSGSTSDLALPLIVMQNLRLQGVTVGSHDQFAAMARAIGQHRLKPVIDKVFPFDRALDAFAHLAAGAHVGKVAIEI